MTDPHFEKPISDLRRRMLQDMTNRSFGDKTKNNYIKHIQTLAKFLGRSPDTVGGHVARCENDACGHRCASSRRSLPVASRAT